MKHHYQESYASLSGDGQTLDIHQCAACHQPWPCDASVLQVKLTELQHLLEFEEYHSNDLAISIEDHKLVIENYKEALRKLQKAIMAEHQDQSSTSLYINRTPPEHARSYMRCDHPLCIVGREHDPNFRSH